MEYVPETTLVDSTRVWCDGADAIRGGSRYQPAALGHPRVYLQMDESGFVDCGYCDRRFILAGGPADPGIQGMAAGEPALAGQSAAT